MLCNRDGSYRAPVLISISRLDKREKSEPTVPTVSLVTTLNSLWQWKEASSNNPTLIFVMFNPVSHTLQRFSATIPRHKLILGKDFIPSRKSENGCARLKRRYHALYNSRRAVVRSYVWKNISGHRRRWWTAKAEDGGGRRAGRRYFRAGRGYLTLRARATGTKRRRGGGEKREESGGGKAFACSGKRRRQDGGGSRKWEGAARNLAGGGGGGGSARRISLGERDLAFASI